LDGFIEGKISNVPSWGLLGLTWIFWKKTAIIIIIITTDQLAAFQCIAPLAIITIKNLKHCSHHTEKTKDQEKKKKRDTSSV